MNNIQLTDIKTELFTRTTITDYGVKFESFDKTEFLKTKYPDSMKPTFIITVNILLSGGINIIAINNRYLSNQQLDEIHRVSKLLRESV